MRRKEGTRDEALCDLPLNLSIDGRILGSCWRPASNLMSAAFERIDEELGGSQLRLIGRVTGSEYAKTQAYPSRTEHLSARTLVRTARCESLRHRTRH